MPVLCVAHTRGRLATATAPACSKRCAALASLCAVRATLPPRLDARFARKAERLVQRVRSVVAPLDAMLRGPLPRSRFSPSSWRAQQRAAGSAAWRARWAHAPTVADSIRCPKPRALLTAESALRDVASDAAERRFRPPYGGHPAWFSGAARARLRKRIDVAGGLTRACGRAPRARPGLRRDRTNLGLPGLDSAPAWPRPTSPSRWVALRADPPPRRDSRSPTSPRASGCDCGDDVFSPAHPARTVRRHARRSRGADTLQPSLFARRLPKTAPDQDLGQPRCRLRPICSLSMPVDARLRRLDPFDADPSAAWKGRGSQGASSNGGRTNAIRRTYAAARALL